MGRKIVDPLEIKEALVGHLSREFKDNLLSVVLFGSAATPRYVPGRSDINIAIVVKSDSVESLKELNRIEREWSARKVVFSFFFTPENIRNSLDVFPLEFSEIKKDHFLLFGTDFFKNLEISASFLRLQCERELKGKLFHLKREFIRWHHKKSALQELLKISYSQFLIIFRGVLSFAGVSDIPHQSGKLCIAIGKTLGVDVSALEKIAADQAPEKLDALAGFFPGYITAIEKITQAVDNLGQKPEK
jgi:predicted nucleotidyltransferase